MAPVKQFTMQQRQRLLQWQNIFGWSLDRCIQGAEREPIIYELLELELSLEPLSDDARIIRRAMQELEPAEYAYWPRVAATVEAIAADGLPEGATKNGKLILSSLGWAERKRRITMQARAMEHWLNGTDVEQARRAGATDEQTVQEVYEALGTPNTDKKRLVALTIAKLDTRDVNRDELATLRQSQQLSEFAHRIEMLDAPLWSFDRNFALLLDDIGRLRATGEWHKAGGPCAWDDGNPVDAPKVAAAVEALEAWLGGRTSEHQIAAGLGDPHAYKEKVWLARCLLTYLRHHRDEYYPRWATTDTNLVQTERAMARP